MGVMLYMNECLYAWVRIIWMHVYVPFSLLYNYIHVLWIYYSIWIICSMYSVEQAL